MYQFKLGNNVIGYSDTPMYIKKLDNGNYSPCDANEADGVSVNSTPYSFADKNLDDMPSIEINEISDSEFFSYVMQTSATAVELAERVVELEISLLEV